MVIKYTIAFNDKYEEIYVVAKLVPNIEFLIYWDKTGEKIAKEKELSQ